MSLFAQLETSLKGYLLSRDSQAIDTLKLLKSAILASAKQSQKDISDEITLSCLNKQIKVCKENLAIYQEHGQQQKVQEITAEIAILEALLPEQLSSDELVAVVDEIMSETDLAPEIRNLKIFINMVTERVGASASKSDIVQAIKRRVA